MTKFISRLSVVLVGESANDGRGSWELTSPLIYESDVAGMTITVPAGFETDFATVPRVPFVFDLVGDTAHAPATLHDYLYSTGLVPRDVADSVLKEACLACGVLAWRAWLMFIAVRTFGASRYRR